MDRSMMVWMGLFVLAAIVAVSLHIISGRRRRRFLRMLKRARELRVEGKVEAALVAYAAGESCWDFRVSEGSWHTALEDLEALDSVWKEIGQLTLDVAEQARIGDVRRTIEGLSSVLSDPENFLRGGWSMKWRPGREWGVLRVKLQRQRAEARSRLGGGCPEEKWTHHCAAKEAAMERMLGEIHGFVGHAVIPFRVGGAVDMYYFPNGIPGTGFATMELVQPDGSGPRNRVGTYELVAFTRYSMPPLEDKSDDHPFNRMERRIRGTFTAIGLYSHDAVLNPGDTCEVPGKEGEPNKYLIFDEYAPDGKSFEIDGTKHCLLLCLEVFRSEMQYAMEHGGAAVVKRLKDEHHYPYSDLEREPVY